MIQIKFVLALLLVVLFCSFNTETAKADRPELAVSQISPLLLLNNPNVVIREDERVFTWRDRRRGRLEVTQVITIMNSDGRSAAGIALQYDSFRSVRNISGQIYDQDGNQVQRLRNRHISDHSAVSGFSLAEDARVQVAEFHHDQYPYTFEVSYRIDFNGLINFPVWRPLNRNSALEKSVYTIDMPTEVEIRYAGRNLGEAGEPLIDNQDNGRTLYTWEMLNRPQMRSQQYGPAWNRVVPELLVTTVEFEFGGQAGSLESWESYGRWIHDLWYGRDELPLDFEMQILSLVDGVEDDREKVEILYRFLQQNTRYVSIQLGIGGLQTKTAEHTQRNRYGDCKGLTNYLRAMLRIAGIESRPALINSGHPADDINPAIPSQRFNHVILCVPVNEDTEDQDLMWVEATSNTFAPGYIGYHNADKYTLVFSEQGGTLMKTPALTAEHNFMKRRAEAEIQSDGTITAGVHTTYGGVQHESVRHAALRMRPRDQASFLDDHIRTSDFIINSYEFKVDEEAPNTASLSLDLSLPGYASIMGNRIFLNPNLMERRRHQVEANENRTSDIYISYPYSDTDEIVWKLPEDFVPEAIPDPFFAEHEFGHYLSKVEFDEEEHTLLFRRELTLNSTQIDASHYEDFRRMLNQAVRRDGGQVVLVRR